MRALGAHVRMLGDKLESVKRRELPNCDLDMVARKVADAQGDTTNLASGLHRKTVRSYDSIRLGVDGALVEVSKPLKEAFDREAQSLQQSDHNAVCRAANATGRLSVNLQVANYKRLGVIDG